MVPFAGPTERAIVLSGATPLGKRIRVGRVEHRYIYTCVDHDGLLWKVRTPQRRRPAEGVQLGLVPRVVKR